MATAEVIAFEQLLEPIPGDSPSGIELADEASADSVFYQVRGALKSARDAEQRVRKRELIERAAVGKDVAGDPSFRDEVAPPDWKLVYDLTTETLATKSKDVWVAAWLIDALTRLHGFAGLRDGFRLTRELCQQYWEDIHPRPDKGGYTRTFSQLNGLASGALTVPINEIPITEGNLGPFRTTDYVDALHLEKTADAAQRARQAELGTATLEIVEKAVEETSGEFFGDLVDDIDEAILEHKKLSELLAERCGKTEDGVSAAPPTTQIKNSLEACRGYVLSLAGHRIPSASTAAEEETSQDGDKVATTPAGLVVPSASIQTREEAFRILDQLATYFRKTEPLSPVSFTLEQIVRWGRMSFPDLMKQLISNEDVRNDLFRYTGITSDVGKADD